MQVNQRRRCLDATLRFYRLLPCLFCSLFSPAANAEYLLQTGAPTFTTAEPVEPVFINTANGNMHLEIPLASPAH